MKYLAVLCLAFLPSCISNEKMDGCGYTWSKVAPAAKYVAMVYEPDWRKYPPGDCQVFHVHACTMRTGGGAVIYHRWPLEEMAAETGYNWLEHEFKHALGYDHPQKTC